MPKDDSTAWFRCSSFGGSESLSGLGTPLIQAPRYVDELSAAAVAYIGVVPADWRDAVVTREVESSGSPYELCVLRFLREGLVSGMRLGGRPSGGPRSTKSVVVDAGVGQFEYVRQSIG